MAANVQMIFFKYIFLYKNCVLLPILWIFKGVIGNKKAIG